MLKPSLAIVVLSTLLLAAQFTYAKPSSQATKIAKENIIIDTHIDVPYRLEEAWVDVTKATADGDFDFPRASSGGLNAPFMSIYIPATLDDSPKSTDLANKLIDYVEAIVGRAPNKFAIATSVADIKKHFAQGLISLPLGIENGSPIQGDFAKLQHFHDRGVRYVTLTHSKSNHISDSSYDDNKQWQGLSDFGKTLIPQMNKIGMIVDISHVSDQAFYQVIELSKAPVLATHSSLRHFTPGFERNMDDKMVKALAKNGGVIQINYGSGFVTKEARQWRDEQSAKRDKLVEQFGEDSEQVLTFDKNYRNHSPYPYATLEQVLDHIDHAVKLVGIDHVGIGSDYDGVGDSLPIGLKDVSSYPNLVQGLLDRDYSEQDIIKILGGNTLRVWSAVEAYAKKQS